jgi:hypothetical protein
MKRILWSRISVLILILALTIFAGAALHLYLGVRTLSYHNQLLLDGSRTTGTILSKYSSSAYGSDITEHKLTYSFSPAEDIQLIGTSGSIQYSSWKQLGIGDAIEIVFDPLEPNRNFPSLQDSPSRSTIIAWTLVITGIGVFVLSLWVRKSLQRDRKKCSGITASANLGS